MTQTDIKGPLYETLRIIPVVLRGEKTHSLNLIMKKHQSNSN